MPSVRRTHAVGIRVKQGKGGGVSAYPEIAKDFHLSILLFYKYNRKSGGCTASFRFKGRRLISDYLSRKNYGQPGKSGIIMKL